MKRKIFLHGYLKDLHPEAIEVEADSVAEALLVLKQFPELDPGTSPGHPVQIDGVETEVALYGTSAHLTDIHVRPQSSGAGGKGGALTQVLIGVSLVALAFAFPAGIALGSQLTISASSLFLAGAGMVAGGVLAMLAPVPEAKEEERSRYISPNKNSVGIGTPIPLLFGAGRIGGHYLSVNSNSSRVVGDSTDGSEESAENYLAGTSAKANKRFGAKHYNGEDFAYEVLMYNEPVAASALEQFDANGGKVFASGYTNEMHPNELVEDVHPQWFNQALVVYYVSFTPDESGEFTFNFSGHPVARFRASNTDSPDNSFLLQAGATYLLKIFCEVKQKPLPGLYRPTNGEPLELEIESPGGTTSGIDNTGSAGPVSVSDVEVRDHLYKVYDRVANPNHMSVIRPIFSSPTPGPNNVPVEGWVP